MGSEPNEDSLMRGETIDLDESDLSDPNEAPVDLTPAIDLTGKRIGTITLIEKIGQGGMGEVWRGRDEDLRLDVAVKVLPPHYAANQSFVARFLREARAVAQLNHPNIVKVMRAGRAEVEGQYIRLMVMDYIEGFDVGVLLGESQNGKLDATLAARIALATAEALAFAHSKGIMHRDIKPSNILVAADQERIKVVDFGLAKLLRAKGGDSVVANDITATGMILGTPHYFSPEQATGKTADERSDVYSLGITIYEMLSGRPPFRGDSPFSIISSHVQTPIPFPTEEFEDIPSFFVELIQAMCAKDPDQRATLDSVIELLKSFLGITKGATPTPLTTRVRASTNLEAFTTSFIGRKNELTALWKRIDEEAARLVTVTGPGGVGKTRLIQEFGLRLLKENRSYPGGIWFCDLTEARDVEGICTAVGRGLNVPLVQHETVEQIGTILSMRGPTILLLDNFEQVAELAQDTLPRWLEAAPSLTVVASSREPLHVGGEDLFPLTPLLTTDDVVESSVPPAVQLFVDRAMLAKRSFELNEENRRALGEIVEKLDGIPLAIELAAARTSVLTPQQILERLPRRFDLLKTRRRDASARQLTLRGAIDWSWELLEDWEKLALAQCSVFQNGFFLEAAEHVLDLSAFDDAPFEIDAVETLLEKSLLYAYEPPGMRGELRFRMYESVREYAGDKLLDARAVLLDGQSLTGEDAAQSLLKTYAAYYLEYAKSCRDQIHQAEGAEAFQRMSLELDNLQAIENTFVESDTLTSARATILADRIRRSSGPFNQRVPLLKRALDNLEPYLDKAVSGDPAMPLEMRDRYLIVATQIISGLAVAINQSGESEEFTEVFERGMELATSISEGNPSRPIRIAHAYRSKGIRLVRSGNRDEAIACWEKAVAALPESAEREIAFHRHQMLSGLGIAFRAAGRVEEAKDAFDRASDIIVRCGDYAAMPNIRNSQATMGVVMNLPKEALPYAEEAVAMNRKWRDLYGLINALTTLASLHLLSGDFDQAMEGYREAEELARHTGDRERYTIAIGNRGLIHAHRGEVEEALRCFKEAEALSRDLNDLASVIRHMLNQASALMDLERWEECEEIVNSVDAQSREIGALRILAYMLITKARVALRRHQDYETVIACCNEASELFEKMHLMEHSPGLQIAALRAHVLASTGQSDAAKEELALAHKLAEMLESTRENPGIENGGVWDNISAAEKLLG